MKFYSPSTLGFYDENIHGPRLIQVPDPAWVRPTAEGGEPDPDAQAPLVEVPNPDTKIPPDARPVSDERHAELLAGQEAGQSIAQDANGDPTLAGWPPLTVDGLRAAVFPEARRLREIVLNRLTGIAVRSLAAGDGPTVAACAALQQRLLDITKDPAVLAVTPEQGTAALREAILDLYRAGAAAAPANIRSVFSELDL